MESKKNNVRKTSPRENANPFSILTYVWMFRIFKKGFKNGLQEEDLYQPLNQHRSNYLGDKLESAWKKEETLKKEPSLRRVLFKVFGPRLMLLGLVQCLNEINLVIMQPISLGLLVGYFNTGQTDTTKEDAYTYAGFLILSFICDLFVAHSCMMGLQHLSMKVRLACCSLIYRKSMRLSKSACGQTTVGQVINLLSNDVERFDTAMMLGHFLWIGPLETAVVTYLMYKEMGISSAIGIAFLVLFVPLQLWLGKKSSKLRMQTALRTDERVRLMNEIISGIQVIKMYTWEIPFAKLVDFARRKEIKYIRNHSYILGFVFSFTMFITRTSIFSSVLAYVLLGNNISAERVFTMIAFYNVIRPIMTMLFAESISSVAEVNVSVKRLNKFMLLEERVDAIGGNTPAENGFSNGNAGDLVVVKKPEETPRISITNMTAKWDSDDKEENTLSGINLEVTSRQLLGIIGPVGSGKSSLLNALLKELPIVEGTVEVVGKVSYASQEPWLFTGSVKQNILFGEAMDEARYKNILRVCALERDLSMFSHGDRTLVGEKGKTLSGGQKARINLARAVYRKADIYLFDDPLSAVDAHVGKELFEDCITGFLKDKICVLVTHQLQYLQNTDKIIILKDGTVAGEGNYEQLKSSGLDFAKLLEEHHQTANEVETPQVKSVEGKLDDDYEDDEDEQNATKEHMKQGSVGSAVYGAYFKAAGGWLPTLTLFGLFIAAQMSGSASDYCITFWVNKEEEFYRNMNATNGTISPQDLETRETIIYVYSSLTLSTIVISIVRSFFFFMVCMKASVNLHKYIFSSLSQTTMKFFNNNPSGRILNRFSKDMGTIDEMLPMLMFDCFEIGLQFAGVVIVTTIVNPWLLLPSCSIFLIVCLVRVIYLRTSRSVKRLEGVTRSPVLSHMSASMQGLTTIRAFSAQKNVIADFDNYQDNHSSAWFIFITSSRTFGFWMDVLSIIYISTLTLVITTLHTESTAGDVGLIITQYIGMIGMIQWGMRQWTQLENQMTSVERVLEYTQIEKEPNKETRNYQEPPKMWPEHGQIQFKNVCLKYSEDDPQVLKDLSFTVNPKEKVGIVGRTGAGKSSLLAAVFQLYETEGNITIDSIDSKSICLSDLRSKISIIPQEPVLFSGTMRKNLDPFEEYTDADLWSALEQVELKHVVAELPHQLSSRMSEGGSNLSVGQRQLVCLARAIIRNNKILVLDEATANVDPQTDALIQATIRRKFADCTVLTIAHRLHTVMDSDKVLVMDAGSVVEFDHPHLLLQNTEGVLYKMLQKTGTATAKNLASIANKSYNGVQS